MAVDKPEFEEHEESQFVYELPLIDYPYNWSDGYTAPSMQQSLHLTKGVYQSVHYGIAEGLKTRPALRSLSIIGFDVLMTWLPFGNAWLHEEWHRAVMGQYGIDSYNEVYDWQIFSETIAVSHVADADLIELKKDHPADMVRLHAAGIEAQYELNYSIEKDMFFYNTKTWDDVLLWLNYANNIAYLYTCASNDSNVITEDILAQEDTNINNRDFTGLDCNAWVYDLFRSQEAYEQRGVHPSGVGVRRYIKYDDLTGDEQDYLQLQFYLSFLNLVDPFLYRLHRFELINPINNKPMEANFSLRHNLTSFGYTIDANILLKQNKHNLLFTVHNYFNYEHYFPGLEVSLLRFPIKMFATKISFSSRAMVWTQPRDQAFVTGSHEWGGLLSSRFALPITKNLDTFIELEGKLNGWVAGNVYLDESLSIRLGFKGFLF